MGTYDNDIAILKAKATAFDKLMAELAGKHTPIDCYRKSWTDPISGEINYDEKPIYEWRIRLVGSTDLKASLLSQ